ncbi:MAG: TonB-dependent receptor, partial [Tannerellaceae bacterium]|nr:TonB-dependent receptor [Tannerellaceae bacterium]
MNHQLMRQTCVALIMLFSCGSVFSQITLSVKNKTIKEIIPQIEKASGYSVFFSNEIPDLNNKKDFAVTNATIQAALDQLFEGTNIAYDVKENDQILLRPESLAANTPQQAKMAIQGEVLDVSREPLVGVTIQVKGSNYGTITDLDGRYTLEAEENAVLIFSYVGYVEQQIPVNKRGTINILLQEDTQALEEVVIIGYGTTKKASLTAAVASMKGEETALKPVANVSQTMAGRMPGVIARQSGGEPGYDNADIFIRGVATTGQSSPLVVIDGVPRSNYSQLDPASIETITVLKDAAAVAPYGIGGANGVILITTKKGVSGKPVFAYNGYVGFQNPTRIPEMVNSYEYAMLQNEGARNSGLPNIPFSDEQLEMYRKTVNGLAGADPDRYPNSRGIHDILRKNAILTYHNLEISGGSDRVNYYVSLGYTSQQGQFETTNMKRYNVSTRLEMKATRTTDVSVSISGFVADHNYPGAGAGDIMYAAVRTPANEAIWYSNGLWGNYLGRSPVALANHSGNIKEERTQLYTTLVIEQQLPFLKGLSIKGLVSYDPYTLFKKDWRTPQLSYTPDFSTTPATFNEAYMADYSLEQRDENNKRFTYQAYINYQNRFGLHDVTFLGVAERIEGKEHWFTAKRTNFPINIDELDQGGTAAGQVSNGGSSSKSAQVGFVYRVGYTYNNRYMLETSGRYDGNYYFAPGHKWAFFPSVAVGWNISEENFIKDNFSQVDMLKIRSSYGESGNLAGSAYQYLSGYEVYGNSVYFGSGTSGVREMKQANPFITWEKAKKFNVGTDLMLWKGLLSMSVDYFYEKRSNMLMTPHVTVPLEYGIDLPEVNGAEMSNQGIEIMVSGSHTFANDLRLDISGNFTYAHNKLLQTYEIANTYDNPNRRRTGRPYETQFGYKALGYYTEDDFNADGSLKTGIASIPDASVKPGDIKYADLSGPNGVPDGVINSYDETVIGRAKNTPQIIYGFSPTLTWKGFDLNALFQGAAMNSIYLEGTMAHPFDSQGSATKLQYDDHWTPENPNAAYPRVTSAPVNHNQVTSSHWMRKAAYLRLKSLEFGYTLPRHLSEKAYMQRVRFYFAAQNLWTWTPFMKEKIDPEAGNTDGRYYYQQQAFSFGINV